MIRLMLIAIAAACLTAPAGADSTPVTPPAPAAPAASNAARIQARCRVDADSIRVTLELPWSALGPAGVLGAPGKAPAAINPDSLAGYLRYRWIMIQDDGMLEPAIRQVNIAGKSAAEKHAEVEMVAGLLDTYTHIGFASGLFREQSPAPPTQIRIEWKEASASFDASQAIQWVEPPAAGAKTLELPGRNQPAGG
jgi:hypothetical protein